MLCVREESLKIYGAGLENGFWGEIPICWLYEAIFQEYRGEKAENDIILIVLFRVVNPIFLTII